MGSRITVFFILTLNYCVAQERDSLWSLDAVSNATIMLYQKVNDTTSINGSATLINHNGRYFLVTAEHVARRLKHDAQAVFRLDGDKPGAIGLAKIAKNRSIDWIGHPVADIAIMELSADNKDVSQRIQGWSFPSYQIYGGRELPMKDADITFLGFPRIDLELQHFSPLTFNCYLSSGLITSLRYDTGTKCNFFYLSIPSMQGCSGSGVYFSVKKAIFFGGKVTVLIGIVHGTASDDTGGKLAAITPSFYIWELLHQIN